MLFFSVFSVAKTTFARGQVCYTEPGIDKHLFVTWGKTEEIPEGISITPVPVCSKPVRLAAKESYE